MAARVAAFLCLPLLGFKYNQHFILALVFALLPFLYFLLLFKTFLTHSSVTAPKVLAPVLSLIISFGFLPKIIPDFNSLAMDLA